MTLLNRLQQNPADPSRADPEACHSTEYSVINSERDMEEKKELVLIRASTEHH